MWHSPSKFSATSNHPKHGLSSGSLQKGKTVAKVKPDEWEPLQGWQSDVQSQDIETIDINLWSKKNVKRSEDAAKGVPRDGLEVYLCWTSNHCPEIPDYEEFVRASLTASLKPAECSASADINTSTKTKPKTAHDKEKSPKNEEIPIVRKRESSIVKSSGDGSWTLEVQSQLNEKSLVRNAILTACLESECRKGTNGEDADRETLKMVAESRTSRTSVSARSTVVTRSAPVSRAQDKTEKSNRKIVSAKLVDDSTNRTKQKRPVAARNSGAKTSLDLKRLTIDLPSSPPVAKIPNSSSLPVATQTRLEVEKATVLKLVEETLKQSSASKKLNFDLPKPGSMSVGDLLSSNPRIVVGPGGDTERDPNVYAALVGNLNLTDHKEPLSPWSHATSDSAIHFGFHRGTTDPHHRLQGPSGSRLKDTARSVLPSVSSGSSVLPSASQLDSTSTGDSVMMRHETPSTESNDHISTTTSDDAKLLKKTLRSAITKYNHKLDARPRATRPQHRGPPGFRPAGKTPLQRAVETAHKKIHGQHYYLFSHTVNSQSSDGTSLPKHSSVGQLTVPRASSVRSNQSEYSISNQHYMQRDQLQHHLQTSRCVQPEKAEYPIQLEGERLY